MSKPQRVHNEWFRKVNATTCECGTKKTEVWSWGEYVCGKFCLITRCCQACFTERVLPRLTSHAAQCGCAFELKAVSGTPRLAPWITFEPLPEDPAPAPAPRFGSEADRALAATVLYKLLCFAAVHSPGGRVDEAKMREMQARNGGNTTIHDELVAYLINDGRLRRDGTFLYPTPPDRDTGAAPALI